MSNNVFVATGLACILALGACGCSVSSSSESTSTLETSVTDDEGNTTTTTTTTSSDGTSTTETVKILSIGEWTDAWMGSTDDGYDVFYAESPEGDLAFLVLHNESKQDIDSFIGETENAGEGLVTVHGQDANFTFRVDSIGEEDGSLTLWFGDDYGTASLEPCSLEELAEGVHEFDPDGKILQL